MRLAIVASGDFFSDYGGGQVYVRNIVDEFARHNEIILNVISYGDNLKCEVREYDNAKIYQVNDESSFRVALTDIHPDIVHANGAKLLAARLCKELDIPCIVTAHHGGIVCPAGTLLNTDDAICRAAASYDRCLKCYLRNTPTGLFWYPLLRHYSQKRLVRIGRRLKKLPFVPFLSPIGESGMIVSQKLADWRELSETATHFIAPSNAIAEALILGGCPAEKISVIPHGIPFPESPHSPFTIHHSPFTNFYYVGRINYVKGIHILLKAFSEIANPDIRLHLIGGAGNKSEQRYMKRLQRQYRKDSRIIWHGKIPYNKLPDTVKDFHCLIHPAIYLEVFGLNISEALAQHKYVIATRCGGAEMQIHDEDEGLLVEPNNADSLAAAIRQYIGKPKPSRVTVRTIADHTTELTLLYKSLL